MRRNIWHPWDRRRKHGGNCNKRLSVSHRLPKRSYRDVVREGSQASSNSRSRAPIIVVKFVRRELRDRFYKARKFLRDIRQRKTWISDYFRGTRYISQKTLLKTKRIFLRTVWKLKSLLSLTFLNFKIILSFKLFFFVHEFNTGKLPTIFDSFFVKTSCKHNVNTCFASRSTFCLSRIRANYGKFNIRFNGPKLWNELDERFKCRTSTQFKKESTSHFISLY